MKKALEDIDGALKAHQQRTIPPPPSPPSPPQMDLTFGIHATGNGRYAMWNSIGHIEGNTLKVDDKEYELTPALRMLILYQKPRPQHFTSDDYSVYKAIVAQTRVRAYLNKRTGSARPRFPWKWKHKLSGMVIPGDAVEEEDEESTEALQTVIGHRRMSLHPHLAEERLERGGRPKSRSIKGMEYLPGDIKGLADKLH